MGFLSGYGYRMAIEAANPGATGDRLLTTPFPAWFLYSQGKITSATYNDVHVTTSDGTTELPVTTTAQLLTIDYASMPRGRSTLYVYYGKSGASAPTASSFTATAGGETGGTLVDNGFNLGADEASVGSPWTVTLGGASTVKYDTAHQGYTSAGVLSAAACRLVSSAGDPVIKTTACSGLTANTAEYRWWCYTPNSTSNAFIFYDPRGATGTFYLDHSTGGVLRIYSDRTSPANTTGYGTAGFHTIGAWAASTLYQYKLVHNFTNKTFTVFRRTAIGTAWTQLYKSGAGTDLPMRSGSVTTSGDWQVTSDTTVGNWIDEFQYASAGITDVPGSTSVQVVQPREEVTSEGDTAPDLYVWGADLDATYLDSANTSTYYGAGTSHKVGVTTGGAKYHYLLKPAEYALLKGTVSSSSLYLYASAVAAGSIDVRCHRLKNYGTEPSDQGRARQDEWVRNGWTCNDIDSYPTWTNRYYNQAFAGATAWQTAGATNSNEVDSTEYVTLSVTGGAATGYKSVSLTSSWIEDWVNTDFYTQGLLLKDSTDSAGASDRQLTITAPSQTNSPVLVISYSSVDANQLSKRKLTSDTYHASTFAVQNRYALTPSENSHAVMACVNAEMGLDFFYISTTGRVTRALRNQRYSSNKFSTSAPCWGLHYDETTGRFWLMGAYGGSQTMLIGYTSPYLLDTPTWNVSAGVAGTVKGSFYVTNGVAHVIYPVFGTGSPVEDRLLYRTYTAATDTWGSTTTLHGTAASGTQRTIATSHAIGSGDVMAGAGEIYLSGSAASYPSFGSVLIGTETFWYAGTATSPDRLTGVTRAMSSTTAAAHSVGATVYFDYVEPSYVGTSYDATNNSLLVMYSLVSMLNLNLSAYPIATDFSGIGAFQYNGVCSIRYDFTDARWENAAGSALSLPLSNTNLPDIVSSSSSPAYGQNVLAMANGTSIITMGEHGTTGSNGTLVSTRVARKPSTTWSSAQVTKALEASVADLGSTFVALTGMSGTTTPTVTRYDSSDSGATWTGGSVVATHSFATPNTRGDFNVIWCSDCTEHGYLGAKGLVYWQHFCAHGTIYAQSLLYPVTKTYTADALVSNLKTYTADALVISRPTLTYTADAVIRSSGTLTYTADAVIRSAGTVTYTADAIVQDSTHTKTYTADGIVKGVGLTLTYTADAIVDSSAGSAPRALSWFFRRRRSNMTQQTKTYTVVQAKGTTKTATWTSPTYKAETEAGILVVLDVTAASGTGGLTLRINAHDLAGSVSVPLNSAPTAVTGTGTTSYSIYPFGAISGALTQSTSGYLPRQFSISVTHGDSSSYTYSVGYCLLP